MFLDKRNDPFPGRDQEIARLNAQIGGVRRRINDHRLAISQHYVSRVREGAAVNPEIAPHCDGLIRCEEEIDRLLEEIQALKDSRLTYIEVAGEESGEAAMEEPEEEAVEDAAPSPVPEPSSPQTPKAPPPPPPAAAPPEAALPAFPWKTDIPEFSAAGAEKPRVCSVCGARVAPGETLCPECTVQASAPTLSCSVCGTENTSGSRFCSECGAHLGDAAPSPSEAAPLICPVCGESNEFGTKFCGDCGTRL